MKQRHVFGYGSLVNRDTHEYAPCTPVRVTGWQRAWRFTPDRDVAFLTVIAAPGAVIDGLACGVPDADWAALDGREFAYGRHEVATESGPTATIYAIPPDRLHAPDDAHPVLLSYLDVVIAGYLREFGRDGVDRFAATTTGWEAPILNDRAAPRYPRAQTLSAAERAVVDTMTERLGCRIVHS